MAASLLCCRPAPPRAPADAESSVAVAPAPSSEKDVPRDRISDASIEPAQAPPATPEVEAAPELAEAASEVEAAPESAEAAPESAADEPLATSEDDAEPVTRRSRAPDVPDYCPALGRDAFVYALGSSTLASLLGPMIQSALKRRYPGVAFRKWGKASSGLARPDFHDWIAELPGLNREYDPDVYVVNLGTNDAQPLWDPRDKWIHARTPEWEARYGERVDALLDRLAGADRRRLIIWVGPTAFAKKNSRQIGVRVHEVIARRIQAFDGHAFYVDAYTATSPRPGEYIETVRVGGKTRPAYGDDGIHLSSDGVRALMLRPLLALLEPCLKGQEKQR
ncbi:MAG: DUF459 domain-containing protein [Myxococcales bacterium]|nr:DUF459 domain-containing protein [Myxococcales bacterium]